MCIQMDSFSNKEVEFRFNEGGFNEILQNMNRCYSTWMTEFNKKRYQHMTQSEYKYAARNNYIQDISKDFTPCCNKAEIELLKKAINITLRNTPGIYNSDGKTINYTFMNSVYKAILLYYYQMQVLEYYLNQSPAYINTCYEDILKSDPKVREIIDIIVSGDAPWISRVRRIILGFDTVKGGKYKKSVKRSVKSKKRSIKRSMKRSIKKKTKKY